MTTPEYTALNERAQKAIGGSIPPEKRIDERTAHFASVKPREPDKDGDTEVLDGVTFTHHFVEAPGVLAATFVRRDPAGSLGPS